MEGKKGKNLKYLRANNTREVLRHLVLNGDSSRVRLSKKLGLSKMTITNIVNDLQKGGYIYESDTYDKENAGSTGPKPIMLRVTQNKLTAIGISASREKMICSLSDIASGELFVDQKKINNQTIQETFVDDVCEMIDKVLSYDTDLNSSIIGIGIATIGLVNTNSGTLVRSTDFLENKKIELKAILEEKYHIPVFVSNDMQAAVIGEQLYGYGRRYQNYLYMGLGNGVGTAVINNGSLITGSKGFAVEAGHMSVNYAGELCECGNRGCLELYASFPVLYKKAGCENIGQLLEQYEASDETTIQVIDGFIRAVSIALTNLNNIFDMDLVIFGHEGSLLTPDILKKIEENVNKTSICHDEKQIKIVTSTFGTLGALRGATSLIFKKFFQGEISWSLVQDIEDTIS